MKVILVDSMHLAYRSAYAHAKLRTVDEGSTGLIYGFLSSMLLLTQKFPGYSIVLCWDKGDSWRKKISSEYKAARGTHEGPQTSEQESILGQINKLKEQFLAILGFKQVEVDSIESDDIIGILAVDLLAKRKDVEEIMIYSGDRDFYQLITDKVRVAASIKKELIILNEDLIKEKYGVTPKDWVKLRAISGDSSDGLKAMKGIGIKAAVTLLAVGVDPSSDYVPDVIKKRWPKDHKFSLLFDAWHRVRMCYKMSLLPKTVDDIRVSSKVKLELHHQLSRVISNPGRDSTPGMGEKFRVALIRFEMHSIVGRRRDFFMVP